MDLVYQSCATCHELLMSASRLEHLGLKHAFVAGSSTVKLGRASRKLLAASSLDCSLVSTLCVSVVLGTVRS